MAKRDPFRSWDFTLGRHGAGTVGLMPWQAVYGIEIGWGQRKNPQPGETRWRHHFRWHWAARHEWQDLGWWAFSPVRPLRRSFFWQNGDGEYHPQLRPHEHGAWEWTGRDREMAGIEFVWGFRRSRHHRFWMF